jgi:ABC-2 type transport system ATP-binding protein
VPDISQACRDSDAIWITGLRKSFRTRRGAVEAVAGIDLTVGKAQIFGFLGPNGAGKTTTLRILTTLMPADSGEARVAGADVRRQPDQVRQRIGYVGQLGGADASATGLENLLLQGRLYGLSAAAARRRAGELIEALALGEFADRVARGYSGGQRRRLEVALGLMNEPEVLFLDEPTTGLDPQNRANLWQKLRALRDRGTTIFLTTHYLDEADQLSDRLAIIDHGRIIAEGTPGELKRRYSADSLRISPAAPPDKLDGLRRQLAALPLVAEASVDGEAIRLSVAEPAGAMAEVLAALNAAGIGIRAASLAEPSLDDVFLIETGRSLRDAGRPAPGPDAPPARTAADGEEAAA